jgi:hypothetical protein
MSIIMPQRTRPTGSEPLKNECISSKQADHFVLGKFAKAAP